MELNTLSPPVCFLFFTVVDIFANNIFMSKDGVNYFLQPPPCDRRRRVTSSATSNSASSSHASRVTSSASSATSVARSRSPHDDDVCGHCRSDRVASSIMVANCDACQRCVYIFYENFSSEEKVCSTCGFPLRLACHYCLKAYPPPPDRTVSDLRTQIAPSVVAIGKFLDLDQMCSLIACSSHFASHDDLVCKKTERRLIKLSTYKGSMLALPLLHLPSLRSLRLERLEWEMPDAVAMLVGQDLRQLQILHLGPSDHGFVVSSDVWLLKLMEILISHATALVSLCLPGLKLSQCAFTNFGMMLAKLPQIEQVGLTFLFMPESDWSLFISCLQGKPYLFIIGWWPVKVGAKLTAKFPRGPFTPTLLNGHYMSPRDLESLG